MPVLDRARIPEQVGSKYPAPFDAPCRERRFRRLGEAGGLTRLGVAEVHPDLDLVFDGDRYLHRDGTPY